MLFGSTNFIFIALKINKTVAKFNKKRWFALTHETRPLGLASLYIPVEEKTKMAFKDNQGRKHYKTQRAVPTDSAVEFR